MSVSKIDVDTINVVGVLSGGHVALEQVIKVIETAMSDVVASKLVSLFEKDERFLILNPFWGCNLDVNRTQLVRQR